MHLDTLGMALAPSVIDIQNTTCPITGDELYPGGADLGGPRRHPRPHVLRPLHQGVSSEFPKRCFQALMVDPKALKAKLNPIVSD